MSQAYRFIKSQRWVPPSHKCRRVIWYEWLRNIWVKRTLEKFVDSCWDLLHDDSVICLMPDIIFRECFSLSTLGALSSVAYQCPSDLQYGSLGTSDIDNTRECRAIVQVCDSTEHWTTGLFPGTGRDHCRYHLELLGTRNLAIFRAVTRHASGHAKRMFVQHSVCVSVDMSSVIRHVCNFDIVQFLACYACVCRGGQKKQSVCM